MGTTEGERGRRTGTVSVLFVDVVASTELRARLGEEAADALRREIDDRLGGAVHHAHGEVVKGLGDGILATFGSAAEAVAAAVAMQQAIERLSPHRPDAPVAIRVGLSAGDVSFEDGDVFGTPVVEASRLCGAAGSGQILVADVVRALARGRGGQAFVPIGEVTLKGLPEPVSAARVTWEPLPDEPPPGTPVPAVPLPGLLMAGAATAYVGQDEVLAHLTGLVPGPAAGSRAVLLAGEPGVGKTRTAAEVARRAHAGGAVVLYGRCDEDMGVPYQPFVEALDGHVAHDPAAPLGQFPGELIRLSPQLGERIAGLPAPVVSDPRTEEYRLFEAVTSWLLATSEPGGLVLVVDDLHWAARATLLLLNHVLKGAAADPASRLLVIGTYRDTEVGRAHPLAGVLADLRRLPIVERVSLAGLSHDGVVALMEAGAGHELDDAGRHLAGTVFTETEGNPFFVVEVLRHLVETAQLRLVDGRWQVIDPEHLSVPEGVRDVIGRRVGRLSPATNTVLSVAGVLGRDFDLAVLAALVDGGEDAALDALDEAAHARIVEETAPDRFRFAHAMVRSTLYEELSGPRRRRLHQRAVDVLEKLRPSDVVALAYHSLEAGPIGGELTRAVTHVMSAADGALAARALSEADARYRQALELIDDSEPGAIPPAVRIEALCGLGEAQRDQGDPSFRETLLDAGRSALAAGLVGLAARAVVANFRGTVSVIGQVDTERVELLQAVWDLVAEEDSATAALVTATLTMELSYDPSADHLRSLAERAVEIGTAVGDPGVSADVLVRTSRFWVTADWAAAPARASEAVRLADLSGDPRLRALARSMPLGAHLGVGDVDGARRLADEAISIARHEGSPLVLWLASTYASQFPAYFAGPAAGAAAVEAARRIGQDCGAPDADMMAGAVLLSGPIVWGSLADHLDTIAGFADRFGMSWRIAQLVALVDAGRYDDARSLLDAYNLKDIPGTYRHLYFVFWITVLARIARDLGDADLGRTMEATLRPYRQAWAHAYLILAGPVPWSIGWCLAAQGRWMEAIAEYEVADRLLAEKGLVVHRVALQRDLAQALLATADPALRDRSRTTAAGALADAERLGLDTLAASLAKLT